MQVLLTKDQIKDLIPHRDPFLLIDDVLAFDKDCYSITCRKNIEKDAWFFNGHFPSHPIMPGVLIIEALAQAAAVYTMMSIDTQHRGKPVFFTSIERAKFKRPVYPGCQLILEARLAQKSRMFWKFDCIAKVADQTSTETTIIATIQT